MTFTIYPAIDIRNGRCVRLFQGDYDQETVYHDSPLEVAEGFIAQGADWLHIVDLDGAKEGRPINNDVISRLASTFNVRIQVGGGIRNLAALKQYINAGVDRVILGSSAISDPDFVKEALRQFPGQIAIGLDARDGYVAVEGWLETSEVHVVDLAKELTSAGATTFIYTDISKDGTLQGPNFEAIREMAVSTEQKIIASGGVSTFDDIKRLVGLQKYGIEGAIVGKALYTNKMNLTDALKGI